MNTPETLSTIRCKGDYQNDPILWVSGPESHPSRLVSSPRPVAGSEDVQQILLRNRFFRGMVDLSPRISNLRQPLKERSKLRHNLRMLGKFFRLDLSMR